MQERLGKSPYPRPESMLLWIHAASMGECASVLPLIHRFLESHPAWQVMVTSVTVTSASLLAEKLPANSFHQFAPLDHPAVIRRFLAHWQPDAALWVESELWPHMAMLSARAPFPLLLANARMSERSFRRWQMAKPLIKQLLGCFDAIFPQSAADGERLSALGAAQVMVLGNLKYDATPLAFENQSLDALTAVIGERSVWLAASTHDGEESLVAETHRLLLKHLPDLLTVIVPRHAARGLSIVTQLRQQGHQAALRSVSEIMQTNIEFYVADTMGELGLFYRLAPVAFLGGSLVPHGGQNILEPLRLGVSVMTGPHTHNFAAMMAELRQAGAILEVSTPDEMADKVLHLLKDSTARHRLTDNAKSVLERHQGVVERLLSEMERFL